MQAKKLLIITIALAIITAGIVAINLFAPKQNPTSIESPLNLDQAEQAFSSLRNDAETGLDLDNVASNFSSSSSALSSSSSTSSSRQAFTDIRQATLKTFDEQTSFIQLQAQDIQKFIGGTSIRTTNQEALMLLDIDITEPFNFYYLKQGEIFRYIGGGIKAVEKITIDNQNYWLIVQVTLFEVPVVALFNDTFTTKTLIPIPDRFLYSSIKSISNENIVFNFKNSNVGDTTLTDFSINLRDYIDKLSPL